MKKNLLLIAFLLFSTYFSFSQIVDSNYLDGNLYVKLYDTSTAHLALDTLPLSGFIPVYGIDTMYWPFKGYNIPLDQTYRLQFSDTAKTDQLIAALQALPMIEFVEKVPLCKADAFTPNDPGLANQAYLTKIKAQQAWDITKGSANIVVAIIDNGTRITHEDLAGNIWVNSDEIPGNNIDDDASTRKDDINGFDVADLDNNPGSVPGISSASGFNHGTHCAGIAAGVTNNAKGIASIGFNVEVMPVKVARNSGSDRELSAPYEGVFYAMKAGADVISMSWGGPSSSVTAKAVIDAAFNTGCVLVAAAGNDNSSSPFFPAAYPNVISVGATDNNDIKASFSNFGSTVDVMAPGVGIFSTMGDADNSYGALNGTSMACPVVAGLAGLILSLDSDLTPT